MIDRRMQVAAGTAVVAAAAAMISAGSAEAAAPAPGGWMRVAHLSPNTPPVDVYLYALDGTSALIVLKQVAYGTASPYESLPQGWYTVAMRAAGAAASSAPVISTDVDVKSGAAYTVAGLGPFTGLTLDVLPDRLAAPAGKADVRIIEASMRVPSVTVSAATGPIASDLHFPNVTGYQTVPAGPWDVTVKADAVSASSQMNLHTGSTYTIAIVDGAGNSPEVLELTDSTGSAVIPSGGVAAGFGPAADVHGSRGAIEAETLWGGLLVAGVTGAGFAVRRLHRF